MIQVALNTIGILLLLDAANQPAQGPIVLPSPMIYGDCVKLAHNKKYLEHIRDELRISNPKIANVFLGCDERSRDDARLLGQRLMDGNP